MRKLLVFVVLLPSIVSPTRVVSWVWEDARGLNRERPTWGERRGPAGTLARGRLRAQVSGAQVKRKLVKNGSGAAVRLHCIQSGPEHLSPNVPL